MSSSQIISDEPDLATKRANQTSAYEELLCLTALYRNVLSTLTPRLEPRALSGYVLELANFIVDAHDVIGWGEISNIKRILQVTKNPIIAADQACSCVMLISSIYFSSVLHYSKRKDIQQRMPHAPHFFCTPTHRHF